MCPTDRPKNCRADRVWDLLLRILLSAYIASYVCCVKREFLPGSLGVFACPSYSGNVDIDIALHNYYFYPVFYVDTKVRAGYWAYQSYGQPK